MMTTQPANLDLTSWLTIIENFTKQSPKSNSETTNLQIKAELKEIKKLVKCATIPQDTMICAKRFITAITCLEKSYEAAIQMQWEDFDKYHKLAELNLSQMVKTC